MNAANSKWESSDSGPPLPRSGRGCLGLPYVLSAGRVEPMQSGQLFCSQVPNPPVLRPVLPRPRLPSPALPEVVTGLSLSVS